MNELLQSVLTVGKIEAGKDQLSLKDINLRETIEQIILEVRSSVAETREINFMWKCTHIKFKTDESKIRHIVINLLNNAIKFSKESNKAIDILVTCQQRELVIDVQDYGVGIPENDLSKLFQPFFRASNAATVAGTGLGLSIVFKSVEILGGKIELKSELKVGTQFKVRLPFL